MSNQAIRVSVNARTKLGQRSYVKFFDRYDKAWSYSRRVGSKLAARNLPKWSVELKDMR